MVFAYILYNHAKVVIQIVTKLKDTRSQFIRWVGDAACGLRPVLNLRVWL
jgi:hypothetical protein